MIDASKVVCGSCNNGVSKDDVYIYCDFCNFKIKIVDFMRKQYEQMIQDTKDSGIEVQEWELTVEETC